MNNLHLDWKIYILNTFALLFSFSNFELILKIFVLIASLIYSCMKIYEWIEDRIKKHKDGSNNITENTDSPS